LEVLASNLLKFARKELPKFHYGIGLAAGGPLFINLEERLIPKNSPPQDTISA